MEIFPLSGGTGDAQRGPWAKDFRVEGKGYELWFIDSRPVSDDVEEALWGSINNAMMRRNDLQDFKCDPCAV